MEISFIVFVNGKKIVDKDVDPEWTLLYYLRNKLRLCGTKLGCAEGGCGACTVMISKYDRKLQKIRHFAINACLAPICSVHGLAVTTVEGIGSTKTRLHPVQERIAKTHGSQCGFCTPGIVMSMYTLLRNSPQPSMQDLEETLQGNLCRCTGYRPIIEGFRGFTENWEILQSGNVTNESCTMGDQCCKKQQSDQNILVTSKFVPYDPTQEPIFPPELKVNDEYDKQSLKFAGKNITWLRPVHLKELVQLKKDYSNSKIVVGNTEIGIETKFKNFFYPILIQPSLISEMYEVTITDYGIKIGACTTIQDLEDILKQEISKQPEYKTRVFCAILNMLQRFAGKQIRNVASIGGNIMTGSPISDLNPIFIAANIILEVESSVKGSRKIVMDEQFFVSYRKNIVEHDEILLAINIPFSKENQYFFAYKQSRRRDDDIAIVNVAFNLFLEPNTIIIEHVNMAFGGMAPTTVTASKTRKGLIGNLWNEGTLEIAYKNLIEDIPLPPDAPGGMVQYRRTLILSMLFRFFLTVSEKLQSNSFNKNARKQDISGIYDIPKPIPKSSQYFQSVSKEQNKFDAVGRPIVHLSAYKHATGEAVYCDDMPRFENELYMAFVLSTKSHANVLSIDASEALKLDGVCAFYSAMDIPMDKNNYGPIHQDEEIFVSKTVYSQGQILGAVVAEDQMKAQRAAKTVKICYEEIQPIIISIEDAIRHKSYYPDSPVKLENGDIDNVFENAPHIIEGQCRTGGQDHFYLETQSVVVVPKKEDDEMEIYASTQYPSYATTVVAQFLDVTQNKIITKVKRIGGGFGGKETKPMLLIMPSVLAAKRLNRPIRCMLDRNEDMLMTGGRNPFFMKYKTAFNREGKLLGCEMHIYVNAGCTMDFSISVLKHSIFQIQNSFNIPIVRIIGYVCKTNIPSNTAFRGYGNPQVMFAAENMIRDVAEYLNKDYMDIAYLNFYQENDITFYNQTLTNCTVRQCWDECIRNSDYHKRKCEIENFNKNSRWKKRGIAIVSTSYGVAFPLHFLNQAGALILVYTDGSVLLTHGGAEMGQGLHTKMIQIASRVLEISISKIHISEISTDKIPNATSSAASVTSDLNGMAVLDACQKIKKRLEPFRLSNPNGQWEEWVKAAYFDRINLAATGFYKTPGLGYDWKTNTGDLFAYYTYGAACTEVEIDCLTGDHKMLRTDIVMDIGQSLNPAIDVGQIEGGFMQGYGLFMLEEMVYLKDGTQFTKGPSTYKIPAFTDIPNEFNVSLLKGSSNPRAVYSSKAVGEPPLFLSSSALFAAKEAIKAARKDANVSTKFCLNAPATAASIRMACQDNLIAQLEKSDQQAD